MPRTQYYNTPGGGIGYRGSSATPVQAYAFQQTPQLRQENRSTSAPVNPYSQAQAFSTTLAPTKQGHATHPSSSSGSTASSSSSNQSSTRQRSGSKDDSALSQSHQRTKSASSSIDSSRQLSAINLSTSVPDLTLTSFDTPAKSSPDRYRRSRNTSSGPSTSDAEAPGSSGKASATDAVAGAKSPAAQHLAALNEKEKGVKSRLRRAFSFGSAAELRKASVENASSARMHQRVQQQEEIDPEDAAIAAKQEAAGIGNSIYSGQGGVFSSSTDNLSIQSTASSASVMLRKMGKGMKKSGRSLKGLFRPKSVIGVPAADSAVQASVGQVSMVNVEAEREKVNVNASPAEQAGGGTGFPKLERNSLEVASVSERPSSTGNADASRKSIMGGERERAEVLAAVRKGILKTLRLSAPSTPGDDNRPGNLALAGDDYFVAGSRFAAGSSRSLPTTPHGGPRNISFSPRIQFHDAFSSSEYDRRGDIATCNRLTPLLAQQIKEEINTFKMEMEVHEMSKPHTHFF
ncbi:putative protein bni4 [Diplodia seriata]|uniref:Protein BNI4 n=1 Tax=Diplodia seriata TaxID=420778 RepID=A0A0G2EWE9_9PEZI|nr:putative protein bni4 [Diplodia seriata]